MSTLSPPPEKSVLVFTRLTKNGFAPTKGQYYPQNIPLIETDANFHVCPGSSLAAGFNLRSAYKYTIPAGGKAAIDTDIQISLPNETYGRIAALSSLAFVHHISVGNSVLDKDYNGNVVILLFNHGNKAFKVFKGMRVAQLVCEKIEYPEVIEHSCKTSPSQELFNRPFGSRCCSSSDNETSESSIAQSEESQDVIRTRIFSRSIPPPLNVLNMERQQEQQEKREKEEEKNKGS